MSVSPIAEIHNISNEEVLQLLLVPMTGSMSANTDEYRDRDSE
jgi:hypothetical protein